MRKLLFAVVATLVVAPVSSGTVKPKPWAWTTAQASAKVNTILSPGRPLGSGNYSAATCKPRGVGVAKRFVQFACAFTYDGAPKTMFVKVRPVGKGGACMSTTSLAAVPAACMRASAAVAAAGQDPGSEVRRAVMPKVVPGATGMFQGFTRLDCFGTDGWYQCSFGEKVTGSANVAYTRNGVIVAFTALTITP